MRDVPGIAWILGAFVPLAMVLMLMAKLGTKPLPEPPNSWVVIETIRTQLAERKLALKVNEERADEQGPYQVAIRRLTDLELGNPVARYIVSLRPLRQYADIEYWILEGADFGMVDANPNGSSGEIFFVALSKLKRQEI